MANDWNDDAPPTTDPTEGGVASIEEDAVYSTAELAERVEKARAEALRECTVDALQKELERRVAEEQREKLKGFPLQLLVEEVERRKKG